MAQKLTIDFQRVKQEKNLSEKTAPTWAEDAQYQCKLYGQSLFILLENYTLDIMSHLLGTINSKQ